MWVNDRTITENGQRAANGSVNYISYLPNCYYQLMLDTDTLLEELHTLINGKEFLQADYNVILSLIQKLEEEESEERLSDLQVDKLRLLRSRF